jgi:outer membrane autotransporter protein
VLPPGIVVDGVVYRRDGTSLSSVTTGVDANTYVRTTPPTESFLTTAPATVVYTTQPDQFVRFYTQGVTGALGSYLTRARDVRGLTPAQIRDVLALPYLPDSVTIVKVSAGTCILSGVAGPILGQFAASPPAIPTPGPWGAGGGEQQYLIGKTANTNCQGAQYLSADAYVNQQLIGANAFWYAPVVGGGNPRAVAAYLDHLPAPTPFGDLDTIYNRLDLLNFGNPAPLTDAMNQLSGEAHTALHSVARSNAEQSVDTLLGRLRGQSRYDAGPAAKHDEPPVSLWLDGRGLFGRTPQQNDRAGYGFQVGGFDAGGDAQPSRDLLIGATAGYSRATVSFDRASDSGTVDTVRGGIYASYTPAPWRITALLVSAFDRYSLTRNLVFLDRSARSGYNGHEINSAAEAGYTLPVDGWHVEILTGLALSHIRAGGFNLIGEAQSLTSLRTTLGARVSRVFSLGGFRVAPELRLVWAHDLLGEDPRITARLSGTASDTVFSVYGARPGRDAILAGMRIDATTGNRFTWFAGYDGDLRSGLILQTVTAGVRIAW